MNQAKKVIPFLVLVFIIVGFIRAGADDPLYLLVEYKIKPGEAEAYETVVNEFMTIYNTEKLPYSILCHAFDDFGYCYLVPLKGYEDLKGFTQAKKAIGKKFGSEKWNQMLTRQSNCYTERHSSILQYQPDLSYINQKPTYTPAESHYTYWGYYYLIPGEEDLFREKWKKMLDHFKSLDLKDIEIGWEVYRLKYGSARPLYIYLGRGKGMIGFFQQAEKRHAVAGETLKKIQKEIFQCMRGYRSRHGWYVRELSHVLGKN